MPETGWLIERSARGVGPVEYLIIEGVWNGATGSGRLRWDREPVTALRFAREKDAAMFVGMLTCLAEYLPHGMTIQGLRSGDEPPRVCQHSWNMEIVQA